MQKTKKKKRCRDGVTCVVLCTLPSIYLVCVVFGTAIPTSFHILENAFHTCKVDIQAEQFSSFRTVPILLQKCLGYVTRSAKTDHLVKYVLNILGVTHLVQHPTATVSRGESPEYRCGRREGRLRPHPVPRPLFAPRRWAGPGVELRRGNSSRPTQVTSDRSTDRLDGRKKKEKKKKFEEPPSLSG